MDAKKAILSTLRSEGCSVLRLGDSPSLGSMAVIAKEGRDVLAILLTDNDHRSEPQQRFCDGWRGVPPVNVRDVRDAFELARCIDAGDFDRSKIQASMSGQVILRTGRKRDY